MIKMYLINTSILLLTQIVTAQTNYQAPVCAWPLFYERPSVEILQNTMVNTCPGFKGEEHELLFYNGVRINTRSQVTGFNVDLNVDGSPFYDDFTIALFVKAMSNEGTILHYKATGDYSDSTVEPFLDLMLTYNTSHTSVVLLSEVGNVLGRVDFVIDSTVYMNTWIGVAVSYDHSRQKVELMMDNGYKENGIISAGNMSNLQLPGRMRIGASFDVTYPRFKGTIICAALYDKRLKQNDVADVINECLPSKWPSYEPNITCPQFGQRFEIIMEDYIVDSTNIAIMSQTARSLIRCADLCQSEADNCVTFTFDKGTQLCHLYDDDHSLSVSPLVGVNYYRKKQNCC